jgi:hypothetical protein
MITANLNYQGDPKYKALMLVLFMVCASCVDGATTNPGVVFKLDKATLKNDEEVLLNKALDKFKEVYGSQCFSDFIEKQKMNSTNGRTSKQVADHLLSLRGVVPVKMYYTKYGTKSLFCPTCSSAVAFRQPPSRVINLNRAFFTSKRSTCRWASTIAHEGLGHSLGGYGHSMKWTRQREDTVPYILSGRKAKYGGDVFSKCCK